MKPVTNKSSISICFVCRSDWLFAKFLLRLERGHCEGHLKAVGQRAASVKVIILKISVLVNLAAPTVTSGDRKCDLLTVQPNKLTIMSVTLTA